MTGKNHRMSLPLEEWPEADRKAWDALFAEGDTLDEDGRCLHWSQATREVHRKNYGEWLSFLACNHPADFALAPHRRVTHERLSQYLAEMNGSLSRPSPSGSCRSTSSCGRSRLTRTGRGRGVPQSGLTLRPVLTG